MKRTMTTHYVKFEQDWTPGPAPAHPGLAELDACRTRLHDRGLIGLQPNGYGYGNVSLRVDADRFVISGTATGGTRVLGAAGYTLVESFDPGANRVRAVGPVRASAETMTHGAVYRANPAVRCVIHVHSLAWWNEALRLGFPATPVEAAYGSPALSATLEDLVRARGQPSGFVALRGHEEGLIIFGPSIAAAEALVQPPA